MTPLCDCSALAVVAVAAFAIGRAIGRRAALSLPAYLTPSAAAPPPPPETPTARRSSGAPDLDALFAQAEREGAVGAAWVVVEEDGVLVTFRRFEPMRSAAMPAEVGEEVGRAVAEAVAEAQTPGGRVLSD